MTAVGLKTPTASFGSVKRWLRAVRNQTFVSRVSAYSRSVSSVVDVFVDDFRQKMSNLLIETSGKSPGEVTKLLGKFFADLASLTKRTKDKMSGTQTDFFSDIESDIAKVSAQLAGSYISQISDPMKGLWDDLLSVANYQGPTDKFCAKMIPFLTNARLAAEVEAERLFKTLSQLKSAMPIVQAYSKTLTPDIALIPVTLAEDVLDTLERLAVPLVDMRTVLVENVGELASRYLSCVWKPMKHSTHKKALQPSERHVQFKKFEDALF